MNKPIATLKIEKVTNGYIVMDGKEKRFTENIEAEANEIAKAIVEHAKGVSSECVYHLHYRETKVK